MANSSKTILVTGSSRGIGKAVAKLAAEQGYRVILHGRTDSAELKNTQKEIKGSLKVVFDVTDKKAVQAEIQTLLKKVGIINVLVNNAGARKNPMKSMDDLDSVLATQDWEINVMGTLYVTQAVLPGMIEKGKGSVVNIGSIKGVSNLSSLSSLTYSAAKAGVISVTKSLAKAYADDGIRFNVVNPGYVETDQVKDWDPSTLDKINEGTLAGRIGQPEEIAAAVMFLASDECGYVTGTEFLVDGGYALKGK